MSVNSTPSAPERLEHLERLPVFEEFSSIAACLTGYPLRIYRPAYDAAGVIDFAGDALLPGRLTGKLKPGHGCLSAILPDPNSEPFTLHSAAGVEYLAPVRVGEVLIGFVRSGLVSTAEISGKKQHNPAVHFLLTAVKKLTLLCASVVSSTARTLGLQDSNEVPNVARSIAEYIKDNRHSKLELIQVAAHQGLSPSYVTELMKKHYGSGFRDFLTDLRIEDAANLLRATAKPVSQIAYDVGFQSLSHFNRAFRKATGSTPTEYRARKAPDLLALRNTGGLLSRFEA
ncbi:MAG: AraC family transcriptional regulator [Verrucomicrobiales bacterium]|nr:AraC family transcriptional regulator [Verrucomicrobiales bacterium]